MYLSFADWNWDRAILDQALAEVIALCSWKRHFTITVSLYTKVYEWFNWQR